MKFNVVSIEHLNWPFSSDGKPSFYIQDGTYKRSEVVDPFPGYAHSAETVIGLTDMINDRIQLDGLTDIYLPAYETPERVNGWASAQSWYNNEQGKDAFGAYIVLSGKRIPIHPAMTRYLIAHEFGHVVQYWIEKRHSTKNLVTAYIKDLRPAKDEAKPAYYGGRTWHLTGGEVFANDFRIAVCQAESEFWPHTNRDHPTEAPRVLLFWKLAQHGWWKEALTLLPSLEYEAKKNG
jgi:hypothetical protein